MSLPAKEIRSRLTQAVALHQQGRVAEAETIYHAILRLDANHFDALQLLAAAAAQTGRVDDAIGLFKRALAINQNDLNVLNNYGGLLIRLGRNAEAAEMLQRAIAIHPDSLACAVNLGTALQNLQHYDQALVAFDAALRLNPDSLDALISSVLSLYQLGRMNDALARCDRAIALRPDIAAAHNNRGMALIALERYVDAIDSLNRALTLQTAYPDAFNNLGNALLALGRTSESVSAYNHAIDLQPGFVRAYINRGLAWLSIRRLPEALADYDRAVELDPGHAGSWVNRGTTLLEMKRMDVALASFERALQLSPDFEYLHGVIWLTRQKMCDWSEWGRRRDDFRDRILRDENAGAPFPALLLNDPHAERKAASTWAQATFRPAPTPAFAPRNPGRIRIGYFSADFRDHPVMMLMAGMFEAHDRETFETFAFSFGPPGEDPVRQRARAAFDHFIDIRTLTDAQAADLARSHNLDIAVDLTGFTQDTRSGVFARRVAPVQVNFLGFPGSLGVDWYDYILADSVAIPECLDADFSEKVIRLPHTFQPNDRRPEPVVPTRAACGLPETGFVFCCFNNTYKITPEVFSIWMRILERVPGSVLWLYAENDLAEANLKREAETRGIDPARLHFARRTPSFAEHLGRYAVADLFLDTLPYNAHTTASDALWAGLPLLTRTGPTFAGRVAASVLTAANLSDLVTDTAQAYEDLAVAIATDPERHTDLRTRTRTARNSPLFDTLAYTRRLETALRTIHARHLEGLAPTALRMAD